MPRPIIALTSRYLYRLAADLMPIAQERSLLHFALKHSQPRGLHSLQSICVVTPDIVQVYLNCQSQVDHMNSKEARNALS